MAPEITNHPQVTVICPTFNRKALLRCALRSVLNQDFSDFEVRVVGDGCTDGTEEIIAGLNDPRLHWFNFPKNTGSQTQPNNEGLRQARGRFIAFIGHDDLWMPWHLSRLVKHLQASGADFVHDISASIGPERIEGVSAAPHARAGYERIYIPTSSWLHRRELIDDVGHWRDFNELSLQIDFDFSRRVAKAGKKIAFLPSLGVLKFHSVTWKFYSRPGEPPQEHWLDSILKSPARLNEKILSDLAADYALHFQSQDKIPFGLARDLAVAANKVAAKSLVRELIFWYGQERWPVGAWLRRRFRRLRSRQRVARGLPSLKDAGL
jgi:hypothetical protein